MRPLLAERLAGLDPDVRAAAKRMWAAHGLAPLGKLDADQAEVVHDWLDWMLGEGEGWPQPCPVELPAPWPTFTVEVPPAPADAVLHECGPVLAGYAMRYQRLLRPGQACPDCGFDPGFPIPDLDACRLRLVEVLGADALVWARALARRLEEVA